MREYSAAGRPDARPGGRDATGKSGTDLGGRERRLELRFRDDPLLPDSAKQRETARGRLGSIRPLGAAPTACCAARSTSRSTTERGHPGGAGRGRNTRKSPSIQEGS